MRWEREKKNKNKNRLPIGNIVTGNTKKLLMFWKIFALFSFGSAILGWAIALFLLFKEMNSF